MNIGEIDKWLKEEEGISYTELGNEFNQAVELSNKCAKKIMQKDKEIERLRSIIKEVRENINKKLNVNSDYVDYDFGTELLRQELLGILDKENICIYRKS